MDNRWKDKISHTILKIFRTYNRIDVLKLPFLEELYEKTFVVPYVYSKVRALYSLMLPRYKHYKKELEF